jgi:predicted AlkP superfamily pyrophosphatase or phosphodiesterase
MRRPFILLLLLATFGCADYPHLRLEDPAPVAVLGAAPEKARAERVVVISIDGLRPDAIEAAHAETIQKLIARGAYCGKAETVRPSITLPSHTAMLTGLDYERHGVSWNNYRPGYIPVPTVFSVATQVGKQTAMIFSKDKFHFLANPKCVGWIYGPPVPNKVPPWEDYSDPSMRETLMKRDEKFEKTPPPAKPPLPPPGELMTSADLLAKAFATSWGHKKFDLTFIHFREPDEYGHKKGWMGPEYIEGVKAVDKAIESVVATIEKYGGFEKIALIVTADHGGSNRGHYRWLDPNYALNVTIPWICVGPGVPAGLKIERVLRTFDTAPTALAFIGIGAPEGIDGHLVEEVLK